MSLDPRLDCYAVLGLDSKATDAEIKAAYRKLAKQFHPDTTGGDKRKEQRFKEISAAYEILSDKRKRTQYEAMRGSGSGGFDLGDLFSQVFQGASGASRSAGNARYRTYADAGGFDDLFSNLAGSARGQRPRKPRRAAAEQKVVLANGSAAVQRGLDVYADLRLALDEAILGAIKEVVTLRGRAKVKIPAGTGSGVKLRLRGKGAESTGGTAGDHYVTVHIDVPKTVDDAAKDLLIQFMKRAS